MAFVRVCFFVEALFVQVFFYYIRYFKIVQVCERRVGVAFDSYLGQVEQARVAAVFVDLFDEDFRPCVRNAPDVDVEYFAWLRARRLLWP